MPPDLVSGELLDEHVRSTWSAPPPADEQGAWSAHGPGAPRGPRRIRTRAGGLYARLAERLGRPELLGTSTLNAAIDDLLEARALPCWAVAAVVPAAAAWVEAVVSGVARACRAAGIPLLEVELGGEARGGGDDVLRLTAGGVCMAPPGSDAAPGDVLMGIEAPGLHGSGLELVERLLGGLPHPGADAPGADPWLRRALGSAHPNHGSALFHPLREGDLTGLVHVCEGGLAGSLARGLAPGLGAEVVLGRWPLAPMHAWIRARAGLADAELAAGLSLGLGMVVVARPAAAPRVLEHVRLWNVGIFEIGRVTASPGLALSGSW